MNECESNKYTPSGEIFSRRVKWSNFRMLNHRMLLRGLHLPGWFFFKCFACILFLLWNTCRACISPLSWASGFTGDPCEPPLVPTWFLCKRGVRVVETLYWGGCSLNPPSRVSVSFGGVQELSPSVGPGETVVWGLCENGRQSNGL